MAASIDEKNSTYITQRTRALPANTLFGTMLEKADTKAAKEIDMKAYESSQLEQRMQRANQYSYELPPSMQCKSAKQRLTRDENAINKEQEGLTDRQKALQDMENRVKYFQTVPTPLHSKTQVRKKMLLAEPGLDFEVTKKMNNIGFPKHNDYNRDKRQIRPPVHKYCVIGDPLEYGMDFSLLQTETHEKYETPKVSEGQTRHYRSLKKDHSIPLAIHKPGEIPANIRAFYGSQLVDQLLSDKEAVEKVKERLNSEKVIRQRRHQQMELPEIKGPRTPRNYGDLSRALRLDKFDGFTFHQPSLMKETYTQEVFDRRYRDPDEFRHQWDEYGKWKEKEIVREKVEKDFNCYMDEQPKVSVNWDRKTAASKPKPEVPPPKEKPAKKPKPQAKAMSKDPAFEDVVFVTPPISPQPQRETVKVSNQNKRDDEFWEFYDQGLPPAR